MCLTPCSWGRPCLAVLNLHPVMSQAVTSHRGTGCPGRAVGLLAWGSPPNQRCLGVGRSSGAGSAWGDLAECGVCLPVLVEDKSLLLLHGWSSSSGPSCRDPYVGPRLTQEPLLAGPTSQGSCRSQGASSCHLPPGPVPGRGTAARLTPLLLQGCCCTMGRRRAPVPTSCPSAWWAAAQNSGETWPCPRTTGKAWGQGAGVAGRCPPTGTGLLQTMLPGAVWGVPVHAGLGSEHGGKAMEGERPRCPPQL